MNSAPSPCLPLPALRGEAGTSGATGQTTRCVGRSIQVAAASTAAEALVGAALNAPSLSRADGLTPEFAGTRC